MDFDPVAVGPDAPVLPGDGVPADLLLRFTFEGDVRHDDGATRHDATCTTCPTQDTGVTPQTFSAHFDGASCLYIAAHDLKPPAFTLATWMKQGDSRRSTIVGRPFNGATQLENSFEFYTLAGNMSVYMIASDKTLEVSLPDIGTWHHFAETFDGSTMTTYLDGVKQADAPGVPPVMYADDDIRIGCDLDFGTELSWFFGWIDEVRLYGRVLSATEIAALATP